MSGPGKCVGFQFRWIHFDCREVTILLTSIYICPVLTSIGERTRRAGGFSDFFSVDSSWTRAGTAPCFHMFVTLFSMQHSEVYLWGKRGIGPAKHFMRIREMKAKAGRQSRDGTVSCLPMFQSTVLPSFLGV